jgi:hypothetical protein
LIRKICIGLVSLWRYPHKLFTRWRFLFLGHHHAGQRHDRVFDFVTCRLQTVVVICAKKGLRQNQLSVKHKPVD